MYYSNTEGQDRIYVYDNNFPSNEVYFYLGEDKKIHEAPDSTYAASGVETICAVDMNTYLLKAESYDPSYYIYADPESLLVEGAKGFPMACGREEMIMYEIPEESKQVTIKPLKDNVTFYYIDKTYSFGEVNDETYGILTLSDESSTTVTEPVLTIVNEGNDDKETSIHIFGYKESISAEYRSTITFTAVVDNPTDKGQVHWFVDGKDEATGMKYTKREARASFSVQAKYIEDGEVVTESEMEKVNVDTSFFARLVAFIKRILRRLPVIVQSYSGFKY